MSMTNTRYDIFLVFNLILFFSFNTLSIYNEILRNNFTYVLINKYFIYTICLLSKLVDNDNDLKNIKIT